MKNARVVPTNYILLFSFTLTEAYIVSYITTMYDPDTVLMAASMTAAITIALTLYAITTKTDFTYYGAMFWIFSWSFLLFGVFFWGFNYEAFRIGYAIIGIIIYSFYLIYDTQLLWGGKRYSLGPDDYVIAALLIYIDII
jgi:hypothetical protein